MSLGGPDDVVANTTSADGRRQSRGGTSPLYVGPSDGVQTRVDQLRGPAVLECDQEGRAVGREVVADLLGILMPQRTRLGGVDREEGRALLVDVRGLQCRHGAVCILHHEEEIEHSNRSVLHELQDRRRDPSGELVARKTDDVYVDGANCHDVSLLGLPFHLNRFERITEAVNHASSLRCASICPRP